MAKRGRQAGHREPTSYRTWLETAPVGSRRWVEAGINAAPLQRSLSGTASRCRMPVQIESRVFVAVHGETLDATKLIRITIISRGEG